MTSDTGLVSYKPFAVPQNTFVSKRFPEIAFLVSKNKRLNEG